MNGGRTWDGREGGPGGGWWGREGGDLLYGHKEKERREGQARGGGKGGPAFPKGTAKHPNPTTAPSTTAQRTHTHTQADRHTLPSYHPLLLPE